MINSPESRARDELTAERKRVAEQLDNLGHEKARDQFDEGFADSGQVTAERGEAEALIGSLVETLDDVDHALTKLDSGAYGVCEVCGGAIGEARLEAMPAARYCIGCAAKRR